MAVYFFRSTEVGVGAVAARLDLRYTYEIWRPSLFRCCPRGVFRFAYVVWWVMHYSRVFMNGEYGILLIRCGDSIVHCSVISPPYFRFPFMERDDIQIGGVWTAKQHRGKGLASFAIGKITEIYLRPRRRIWYITDCENHPSCRVAEKGGLMRVGEGGKVKRFGFGILGSYRMLDKADE